MFIPHKRNILSGDNAGSTKVNTIEYVTISTTGNSSDFGDSTTTARYSSGCSNAVRGLKFGGNDGSAIDVIDFITIATLGNAKDFGDLLEETTSDFGGMDFHHPLVVWLLAVEESQRNSICSDNDNRRYKRFWGFNSRKSIWCWCFKWSWRFIMSEFKVNTITNRDGSCIPQVCGITTLEVLVCNYHANPNRVSWW